MMARKRSKVLTERQKNVLRVLEDFQDKSGYPPSIREICDHANITSTSLVNYYLEQLQEMGYIERDNKVSRGIRLVRPLSQTVGAATAALRQSAGRAVQAVSELLQIPMVGRIAAGEPMPVPPSDFDYYDSETMVDVAISMLPSSERTNLFALEVKGDSMIDAMINDGDIVIMRPAKEAHNGEMVAVWLNDREETTLKYFYLEKGRVRLQPANPTMNPIIINDPSTVQIQGKVVLVIRKVPGLLS